MARSLRRICILAAVALAAAPGSAAAGTIVFEKGDDIWAMNDDGSNQHRLLALADVPGQTSIGDVQVDPHGALITFTGETTAYKHYLNGSYHCGTNCSAVYVWLRGALRRLQPDAAYCVECSSFSTQPAVTADGRIMFERVVTAGSFYNHIDLDQSLRVVDVDGANDQELPTGCDGSAEDPAPDPADAAAYAYTHCYDSAETDAPYVLELTSGTTHTPLFYDDAIFDSVQWRPDGGRLVTLENGADPGIWTYDPSAANPNAVQALADPSTDAYGRTFAAPHFAGGDRIVFAAQGDIWTIPAGCDACAFPGGATRLTTDGGNSSPSWTAAADVDPPAPQPPPSSPAPQPPPQPPAGPAPGQTPATGGDVVERIRALGRTFRASKGFRFEVALRAPATLQVRIQRLGHRTLGTVRLQGKSGSNRFTIRKVGRRALRPGRYKATVRASGSATATTLRFALKR